MAGKSMNSWRNMTTSQWMTPRLCLWKVQCARLRICRSLFLVLYKLLWQAKSSKSATGININQTAKLLKREPKKNFYKHFNIFQRWNMDNIINNKVAYRLLYMASLSVICFCNFVDKNESVILVDLSVFSEPSFQSKKKKRIFFFFFLFAEALPSNWIHF